MNPQEEAELNLVKSQLAELRSLYFKGDTPNKKEFDKTLQAKTFIAKEGLTTEKNGLHIKSKSNTTGIKIFTGSASGHAAISGEVGLPGKGSLYISTNGTSEIWWLANFTWTQLNLP